MLDSFKYTAPEPLVIDFDPPVKAGNGQLERLCVHEPTAARVKFAERQLSDINGSRGGRLYLRALISKVSGIPEEVLASVPMRAFQKASDYVQSFVRDGVESQESDEEPAQSFTITFDPPLQINKLDYPTLTVNEPTLDQMLKCDGFLRGGSAENIRAFQINLVSLCSGENSATVGQLPISVVNRAATFLMGFTRGGRAT